MVSEVLSLLSNVKRKLFNTSFATLWYILLIMLLALLSFAIYLVFPPVQEPYLFYFPKSDTLRAELHRIPVSHGDRETTIENYINELLLGPLSIKLEVLFPRNTVLNTIMLRGDILYVNIEPSIFVLHDPLRRSVAKTINLFKLNILKNFHYVNKVVVLIDGKEV